MLHAGQTQLHSIIHLHSNPPQFIYLFTAFFLFLKASVRSRVFALALHCGFPWGSAAGLWFLMKKWCYRAQVQSRLVFQLLLLCFTMRQCGWILTDAVNDPLEPAHHACRWIKHTGAALGSIRGRIPRYLCYFYTFACSSGHSFCLQI